MSHTWFSTALILSLLATSGTSDAARFRGDFPAVPIIAYVRDDDAILGVHGDWTFEFYFDPDTRQIDYFSHFIAPGPTAEDFGVNGTSADDTRRLVGSVSSLSLRLSGDLTYEKSGALFTNPFLVEPSSTSSLIEFRYQAAEQTIRLTRNQSLSLSSCVPLASCNGVSVNTDLVQVDEFVSEPFDILANLRPIPNGDADGNGAVEFADFLRLADHFGQENARFTFQNGDFDYDNTVAFADFLVLADNFGTNFIAASVPEPELHPMWLLIVCILPKTLRCVRQ